MAHIPEETLDHIFSYIDDPKDLLSPILTSKLFASVVRPHLEYRVIRCTLATTDLWNHLSKNAALAKNVRTLEIQRQQVHLVPNLKDPIVPKNFLTQAYDPKNRKQYAQLPKEDLPLLKEAETALIHAIKNMSNLKSFVWHRCPPLLNSKLDEDIREDVWTALGCGCPNLEHLNVTDASEKWNNADKYPYILPIHHSKIWTLQNDLKSFSYHSYAYRYIGRDVPVDELTAFLRRCSNLEVLGIGFTLYGQEESDEGFDVSSADLNELMANMHWPRLRSLQTFSIHVLPSTARKFFGSHPTISTLEILEGTNQARFIKNPRFDWYNYPLSEPDLTLLPGSLPNLENSHVPEYVSRAITAARALPGVS